MEIVFLNRLSKRSEEQQDTYAQVWIGEQDGVWSTGWSVQGSDADDDQDDLWYEGGLWQEMLCVYRHELALKMAEGYRPIMNGVFHEKEETAGRGYAMQKLYCYSDLYPREDVYEELTLWRRKKAVSERKAPYFIANNRLLKLISVYLPHTESELHELPGMGDSKMTQYGTDILEITSKIDREREFPLDWVQEIIDQEAFLSWLYKQKEEKYRQELNQFHLRRTILEGILDGLMIEDIGQQTGLNRREVIEIVELVEKEGYDVDALISRELVSMSEEEQSAIWNAYEELGDAFLKPVMLQVYGEEQSAVAGLDQIYERLRLIRIRYRRNEPTGQSRNAG